jgi:hypothetical protein
MCSFSVDSDESSTCQLLNDVYSDDGVLQHLIYDVISELDKIGALDVTYLQLMYSRLLFLFPVFAHDCCGDKLPLLPQRLSTLNIDIDIDINPESSNRKLPIPV